MSITRMISVLLIGLSFSSFGQHADGSNREDLKGVIAAFRCSGAFVSLGQEHYDSGIILSAGHCSADEPTYVYESGYARVDLPIHNRDEHGMYYHFDERLQTLIMKNFKLGNILYATMTKEDVTLFESQPSTRALQVKGLKSFTISKKLPSVGQKLSLTSAFWGKTKKCTVERIIKNNKEEKELFGKEPEVPMENTILLSEDCTAKGGWSGSPLYDPKTRVIYGVASRIAEAREGSKLYKPQTGNIKTEARVLVSSVSKLAKCLTLKGKLDLSNPACELPK